MARYNINDKPQQAQSVNVGQFGPSYDSLQDWRSVFTAANEVARIKEEILVLDVELDILIDKVEDLVTEAENAVNIANQVADATQKYVAQAAADIAGVEAIVTEIQSNVLAAEADAEKAAQDSAIALQESSKILEEIKAYQDDFSNLTVTMDTPDAPATPNADFNNVTNNLHLTIPKSPADFTGAGSLPIETTPNPDDFLVGAYASGAEKDKAFKVTIGRLTQGLSTGTKVRGIWYPTTNIVELDPENTSLTKNTAPNSGSESPDGAGYSVAEEGDFDLYGTSNMNHFEKGDFVQWSVAGSSWIHQQVGNKVLSVNGQEGVINLTAEDVGAVSLKNGGVLEGQVRLSGGQLQNKDGNPIFWTDPTNTLIVGDVTNQTTLEGKGLYALEPNPVSDPDLPATVGGRIFHAGYPPTEDELNMYTKNNTYSKLEINAALSEVDKLLDNKAPYPPKGTQSDYIWDGVENKWKPMTSSGLPMGSIVAYYGKEAPANMGFLECKGQLIESTSYPAAVEFLRANYPQPDDIPVTSAKLPDLRGEFIRGWDHNKGVDTGREFGSFQSDSMKAHSHTFTGNALPAHSHQYYIHSIGGHNYSTTYGVGSGAQYTPSTTSTSAGTPTGTIGNTGGIETRPRNVAVMYIMKVLEAEITEDKEVVNKLADWVQNIAPFINPIGNVISYYGETPPTNYLECDGSLFEKAKYPELYELCKNNKSSAKYDLWLGELVYTCPAIPGSITSMTYYTRYNNFANVMCNYASAANDNPLKDGLFGHIIVPEGHPNLAAKLVYYPYGNPSPRYQYALLMIRGTETEFSTAMNGGNTRALIYKQEVQILGNKKETSGHPVTWNGNNTNLGATFTNGVGTFNSNVVDGHRPFTRCIIWTETGYNSKYSNKLVTPVGRTDLIVRFIETNYRSSVESNYGLYYIEPVKGTADEFCAAVAGKKVDIYEPAVITEPPPPPEGQAYLPDLRGEFLRGWDNGRGVDVGREFGSFQEDGTGKHSHTATFRGNALPAHNHYVGMNMGPQLQAYAGGGMTRIDGGNTYTSSSSSGTPTGTVTVAESGSANETRPRNVAVMYCIYAGPAGKTPPPPPPPPVPENQMRIGKGTYEGKDTYGFLNSGGVTIGGLNQVTRPDFTFNRITHSDKTKIGYTYNGSQSSGTISVTFKTDVTTTGLKLDVTKNEYSYVNSNDLFQLSTRVDQMIPFTFV